MSDPFIESKDFIEHLNSWLFKSTSKDSNWIYSNRNKIPKYFRINKNYLYKGLIGVPELFQFKTGFVRLDGVVSFSEDEHVAKSFVNDSKFKFRNSNGIKIIVKKRFTNIVFDIYKYYLYYGENKLTAMGFDDLNIDSMMKEKEILLKDVKVYAKDFYILK